MAEGIETPVQSELCLALGVHFGQAICFGRPSPKSETDSILQAASED